MRYSSRAKQAAIVVATVLFASLLTVAAPAAATAAGTASISGAVLAETGGSPLANASVTLYARSGSGSSAYWSYRSSSYTDASGAYAFANLDAGTYTLEFDAPYGQNYIGEWWKDKATQQKATGIKLSSSTQKAGVNAKLTTGGIVKGKITASFGLEDAYALLLTPDQKKGYHRWAAASSFYGFADANGYYTITGIRPGKYSVAFRDSTLTSVAPRYYGNTDNVTKAKSFTVTSGGTVSGIDVTLVKGVSVSGKVTTSSGKAVSGAVVQVAHKITVDGKPFWEYDYDTTGSNGKYSVKGLAAGKIGVKVIGPSGKGYASTFYGGGASFEKSKTFTLKAGASKKSVNVKLAKKLKVGTPKITGKAKVGSTLKVKKGTWSKGTKFAYQWYADGKAIKKGTKSSLTLTKSQKGKKITVQVRGYKAGYAAAYKTSKATKKVG